jgi:hypothetical protein
MAMRVQISSSLGKTGIMVRRSSSVLLPDFSFPSTMICGGCSHIHAHHSKGKELEHDLSARGGSRKGSGHLLRCEIRAIVLAVRSHLFSSQRTLLSFEFSV